MTVVNNLDDIDLNILEILSKESNRSYREIKNEINVSIGTIHNRIQKLKSENGGPIEGFSLKLNNARLGFDVLLLINLQVNGKFIEEVLSELSREPRTCSIFQTMGEYNAIISCYFKSTEDAFSFVQILNTNEKITKVMPISVLKTYKNDNHVQIKLREENDG